ncbi:glycosyltransferase family 2 protein [Pueribacillus theae]|uniref:Glycosyltransferase family 2 protein n=1 Tax=Pueribacillus theae TaxID=2171751 RepID=A0A2U1K6L0_9BACI|nr:glycosyltransferase family 2 protein [Pueribacillus theae]PWA12885.1 glycosyltransferase family 2 protein [Pueribacillus theae]
MSFFIRLFSPTAKKINVLFDSAEYNEEGYYIYSPSKKENYKVTVIMPVYNAEKTLRKAIESVINQSIGFENVEFIIIDDKSSDGSRSIILEYAKTYPNIVPIFFKKNNGSPAIPRNIGMKLAKGEYIKFIDSDDWLAPNGIETLYNLLVKTGDHYAIGRTIKAEDGKYAITGEYNSCENRDSIHPCSIPHVFQHLGPTARMMRTQFLREYNCKFPNMKYAEDKQFFIDVLTNCPTISTSKEVIYYVNRNQENKSLVSRTSIFEKTDTNIAVIKHVIKKNLPENVERMVLNRLYEFDCITRLFNRHHFLRSIRKDRYFKKFAEVLDTTKGLRYDFTENFFEPWHKVLVQLFKEERFEDIVTLIQWSLKEKIKETVVKDGLPYYKLPFEEPYQLARMDLLAVYHSSIKESDQMKLYITIYGDLGHTIDSLVIRERHNQLNEIEFPIKHVSEHLYEVALPYGQLTNLTSSSYQVYVKYDQYRKLLIKMNTRNIISHGKRELDFYTTIGDNYGLNIK